MWTFAGKQRGVAEIGTNNTFETKTRYGLHTIPKHILYLILVLMIAATWSAYPNGLVYAVASSMGRLSGFIYVQS